MNGASIRPSLRQDESSGTSTWVAMSFTYSFRRSSQIGQSPVLSYSLSYGHRQEVYGGSSSFIPVYTGSLFRTSQSQFQRLNSKDADCVKRGEHLNFQHDRREVGHLQRGIVLPRMRNKARALRPRVGRPQ